MKNKKKLFEKILLGILTFLLICYTSIGILLITFLNVSKNYINRNKISNIVDNIEISDILKKVSGNQSEQINIIKNELLDIGLSEDSFNAFVNSDDVQQFGEEIVTNVLEQLLSDNNIDYQIDENRVRELLQNNIPELQVSDEFVTGIEDKLTEKIEAKIPILVNKLNILVDDLIEKLENSETFVKYKNYLNKSLNIFDIIYSDIVNVVLIVIIISFITLLIYIRKSINKSLKWISICFFTPSFTLFLISFIKNKFINIESGIIDNVISLIINDFNVYALIYLIITIIAIIINIIIYIIKRHKNKEVEGVLHEEEKQE